MGPADQDPVERTKLVLVYTSAPLVRDLDVVGDVAVTLHAATDAPDTDFTARLCIVDAAGRSTNLLEGIVRARYRDSAETPDGDHTRRGPRVPHRARPDRRSLPRRRPDPPPGRQLGLPAVGSQPQHRRPVRHRGRDGRPYGAPDRPPQRRLPEPAHPSCRGVASQLMRQARHAAAGRARLATVLLLLLESLL